MTGTDTVGGALRAAVERVHRPECPSWSSVVVFATLLLEDEEWGPFAASLFGAGEAADLGVLPR